MITSLPWRTPPERISSSPATHISPNSSKLGRRWSLQELFCSNLPAEASLPHDRPLKYRPPNPNSYSNRRANKAVAASRVLLELRHPS
jgi:hypothetical protein